MHHLCAGVNEFLKLLLNVLNSLPVHAPRIDWVSMGLSPNFVRMTATALGIFGGVVLAAPWAPTADGGVDGSSIAMLSALPRGSGMTMSNVSLYHDEGVNASMGGR